jgi:hypothetical protein
MLLFLLAIATLPLWGWLLLGLIATLLRMVPDPP